MDIEGDEYNIVSIDKHDLKNLEFIVFEMHWLDKNKRKVNALCEYFKEAGFSCFHAHGNNCVSNQYSFNSEECPEVIEITLVKGIFTVFSDISCPIENIDYRNDLSKSELQLGYIKNRQNAYNSSR